MSALLIVLVLNVHEECFDVLWLGVTAILIECQIIIGKLTLVPSNILNKSFILFLEGQVCRIVLINIFDFLLHLIDFIHDFSVFLLEQVGIVSAIINLSTGALSGSFEYTPNSMIRNGSLHNTDLSVLSHS